MTTTEQIAAECERIAVREEAVMDSVELTMRSHNKGFDPTNGREVIDTLRSAAGELRALAQQAAEIVALKEEREWRPISEAPKYARESRVSLAQHLGQIVTESDGRISAVWHKQHSGMALYFMPLPTPPKDDDMSDKPIQQMTDNEIVSLMRGSSLLAEVRRLFYHGMAEMEQEQMQRTKPTIIEMRKREFIIAQRIIKAVREAKDAT